MRLKALASLIFAFALTGAAWADDLADFNAAVEAASAHNRVAIEYLRNGNADLAAMELDRMREAWAKVGERKRPTIFAGDPLYTIVMTDIATRLVTADLMLNVGRPENARQSLLGVRKDLYDLRKSAHIVVLADCVRDANEAMDKLMAFDSRPQDFGKPEFDSGLAQSANTYGDILSRCDGIASETTRKDPEFRRLIDGAAASLAKIPTAIAEKDADLLHRLLGELRSFDHLLAFRYG
jgi:hypothetical protein